MSTEQKLAIAAEMYAARRLVKWIAGDEYAEKIKPWVAMVNMRGVDQAMQTCLRLTEEMTAAHNEAAVVWLLAATVELLEPSEANQ